MCEVGQARNADVLQDFSGRKDMHRNQSANIAGQWQFRFEQILSGFGQAITHRLHLSLCTPSILGIPNSEVLMYLCDMRLAVESDTWRSFAAL